MSGDTFDFLQGARETITGTLHDPAATTGDVLTVQADKSIAAQPGGGSGGVQTVTVPVSSAQILAFNTPVELVPGVPGELIWPVVVVIEYVAGATPYTDHGGSFDVAWGDPSAPVIDYNSVPTAGLMDQATSQLEPITSATLAGTAIPAAPIAGLPLMIGSNGHALLTDGDGTLNVTVFYVLITVV